MSRKILVIEDSPDIADLLALHLGDEGYQVELAQDGRTGLRKALEQSYDLVILDLMLPEVDGLEICRQLRAAPSYTPILMLTARSTEIDRVVGLELGADDYLTRITSYNVCYTKLLRLSIWDRERMRNPRNSSGARCGRSSSDTYMPTLSSSTAIFFFISACTSYNFV